MALGPNEELNDGFVRTKDTKALVVTTNAAGATIYDGFLRDPDGRLVVVNA